MMQSINLENLLRITEELENLEKRERTFKEKIKRIYANYENKKYDYKEFKRELNRTLEGKTEKKFFEEIEKYRKLLLRTLKHENEKIIFHFYHEEPEILREMQSKIVMQRVQQKVQPVQAVSTIAKIEHVSEEQEEKAEKKQTKKSAKQEARRGVMHEAEHEAEEIKIFPEKKEGKIKKEPNKGGILNYLKKMLSSLFKPAIRFKISLPYLPSAEQAEPRAEKAGKEKKEKKAPMPKPVKLKRVVLKVKPLAVKLFEKEKPQEKKTSEIIKNKAVKKIQFSSINPFLIFKKRMEKSRNVISEKTEIPIVIETLGYKTSGSESFEKTYLKKEAERIQKILETERAYKGYSTTIITSIGNIMVKKISLKLLNLFPDFFKKFYKRLREANIGLLSNTYVNLMVFFTLFSFTISLIASSILFFILYDPLYLIMLKSAITATITSAIIALIFYTNPNFIISKKRKSIEMNMPFAINHMSAIATAGVPPLTIFKLVVEKKEYGEFSEQLQRIVDYVELFGVNLLLAIKTVSSTSPSPYFKEFLEGLSSSIESGVGVEKYLKQKAKESLTRYNLERKKYNETIATFSDIYTAVLVAAPLLFIATLAMVNLLGGKIAGLGISTLMMIGVYVIIPLLNIIFIIFIKSTQPGV
ncbi:MAG: type II secretion system F family protein [Candidatus Woesearchaeota archaeon]